MGFTPAGFGLGKQYLKLDSRTKGEDWGEGGVSLRRLEGSGGHSHRHVWGLEVKGKSYTKTFRERPARLPQVRAPE